MYGLVQKGLKDMVCHTMSEDVWRDICRAASYDGHDFEPLQTYPDSLTAALVDECAKRMQLTHHEVLRQFGRYWIAFTAHEGYGPILDLFGTDLKTCLSNLNRMHGHMGAMMPSLQPPRFRVTANGDSSMTLHYYSGRTGLAPMVLGLIEGLSEKFSEPVSINHIPIGQRSDHDEFEIQFTQ
jgi:hypothetical protein